VLRLRVAFADGEAEVARVVLDHHVHELADRRLGAGAFRDEPEAQVGPLRYGTQEHLRGRAERLRVAFARPFEERCQLVRHLPRLAEKDTVPVKRTIAADHLRDREPRHDGMVRSAYGRMYIQG